MKRSVLLVAFVLTSGALACAADPGPHALPPPPFPPAPPKPVVAPLAEPAAVMPVPPRPTIAEAVKFVAHTNEDFRRVEESEARADWLNETYINEDTDALAADAAQATAAVQTEAIQAAVRFKGLAGLPADTARALELLSRTTTLPFPTDPARRKELADLAVKMQSAYGKGTYCSQRLHRWAGKDAKGDCLHLDELERVLKDPKASWDELSEAWTGWRTVSMPMRKDYQRFVELGNGGAKEIGFSDVGALWKERYDMPAADMEKDVERLWQEVRPLYRDLRCYAGKRLRQKWGKDKVPAGGLYPAQVFGNMWSQSWENIGDLLEPFPTEPSIDASKGLVKKKTTPKQMVAIAEGFFVSLGLPKLPDTFWTRSMFERPRDREVVCHASAWPVTFSGDVRIKTCVEPTEEDLVVLHHELGHDYYYLAYQQLPVLFQDGANDGFHEAIGDTIALSVTPPYLANLGILDKGAAAENEKAGLNALMHRATQKVAFLPFGLLIDKWRWDVFSGKIAPDHYNQAWWELVAKYQGMAPPSPRGEEFFDPGAKYHVASNTPYLRYFLATIYQFQFHRALCRAAGHTGPLYTCSIYGNKAAGELPLEDAADGRVETVARGDARHHRREGSRRERHARVLRAAREISPGTEPGRKLRLAVGAP